MVKMPSAMADAAADYALAVADVIAAAREREDAGLHPMVGLYCHKSSTDPEMTRFGWNWNYQACVHSVVGDHALLQFFDALMGDPSDIRPVPLSELLSGEWLFYDDADAWKFVGGQAMNHYWNSVRREEEDNAQGARG